VAKTSDVTGAKRLMGALLRMPPKPHADMKLGKPSAKAERPQSRASKRRRATGPKRAQAKTR